MSSRLFGLRKMAAKSDNPGRLIAFSLFFILKDG
jgi:hypothetical protein